MTWTDSYGNRVTDKAVQGYLPVYQRIAAELGARARVLELGLAEGYSLRLWTSLFPFGDVTGVQGPGDLSYVGNYPDIPHCRVLVARAEDPTLPELFDDRFDLIVDDASHDGGEAKAAFNHLWPLLNQGGYYVIEDWYVGIPGHRAYTGNMSMLETVQGLLLLLDHEDAECDEITYRHGLAVIHKRRKANAI